MTSKTIKMIFVMMIIAICIFCTPYGMESNSQVLPVFATSIEQKQINLQYPSQLSIKMVNGTYYSKMPYEKANVSVSAPPGSRIKSMSQKLANGTIKDITPTEAKGRSAYKGDVALTGTHQFVESKGNSSTNGYFTWFRNKISAENKGNWFADIKDSNQVVQRIQCQSKEKELIMKAWMSQYPGCSSGSFQQINTLVLDANRTKSFIGLQQATALPDSVVTDVSVGIFRVNPDLLIQGPKGVRSGYALADKIKIFSIVPITKESNDKFRIFFHQDFDYLSDYSFELNQPPNGSKLMVYYTSFVFDVRGSTYQYPTGITVEYEYSSQPIPSTKPEEVVNRNAKPKASITKPNGVEFIPTHEKITKPEIHWEQTDSDLATTFTYFQIQVYADTNDRLIYDSGQQWQSTTATMKKWSIDQDLPRGQKLRIQVRVFDGKLWSDYSESKWLIINQEPVASFVWSPKPIWEGDQVSFSSITSGLDGDQLSYVWTIRRPDGQISYGYSKDFMSIFSQAGQYMVHLSVSDGFKMQSSSANIVAFPLTILADTQYLPPWLVHHNEKKHQTVKNPKDFYSGEKIIVTCQGADAPITEVKAFIQTKGLDGKELYVLEQLSQTHKPSNYSGELYSPIFQSMTKGLPIGEHLIHVEIKYTNGVVKHTQVPIRIIGNVRKAIGVHRLQ